MVLNYSIPSHDAVSTTLDSTAALFLRYGAVELRRPKPGGGAISGVFDDAGKLAKKAQTQDGLGSVYVTINPVGGTATNRLESVSDATDDSAVTRRHWLLLDIDPVRPSNTSATDAEKQAALDVLHTVMAYLRAKGWPEPVEADSGNGGHALYSIDLPNDEASKTLVKGVLGALAAKFDAPAARVDTTVYNAARITKLYGTMAVKGEDTPERPYRRSGLVSVPDALEPVPVELLQAVASLCPAPQRETGQGAQGQPGEPRVKQVRDPASYAVAVLDGACRAIREAAPQTSHDTTLKQARLIGGYVAGVAIDVDMARKRLVDAAVARSVDNAAKWVGGQSS